MERNVLTPNVVHVHSHSNCVFLFGVRLSLLCITKVAKKYDVGLF